MLYTLAAWLVLLLQYTFVSYLVLNVLVRFVLPAFLPLALSISHFTPTSIHNLAFQWKGAKLVIGTFGISACGGGKAWFLLYGKGIRLTIPRSTVADKFAKDFQHKRNLAKGEKHQSTLDSVTSSRRFWIRFLVQRFTRLVSIRLEFHVELEEVGLMEGVLNLGARYQKPQLRVPIIGNPRQEDQLTLSATIEKLKIIESTRGLDQKEGKRMLPALDLQEKLTLKLSGPIGSEEWKTLKPRPGSVRASIEKEDGKKGRVAQLFKRDNQEEDRGLVLRLHEVKRLIGSIEKVACEMRSVRERTTSPAQPSESSHSPAKPSPLLYFDSFAVSFPTVVLSLHYNTPLSVIASSSPSANQSLPEAIAFAAIVSGIKGNLKLKARSDDASIRDSHKAYLGKGRVCEIVGSLGWEELEGRIDVDPKEEDIASSSAKTLSIGRSEIALTSTWLPHAAATHTQQELQVVTQGYKSPKPLPAPRNYNDPIVMLEVSIGTTRGQTTFETLDAALRIFAARPRTPARECHPPAGSDDTKKEPKSARIIPDLPRFSTAVTMASLEVRLLAPTRTPTANGFATAVPPRSSFYPQGDRPHPNYGGHHPFGRTRPSHRMAHPDESHESFFLPWQAPEILSIEVPQTVFTSEGEWRERSVRRNASDRLKAKRLERIARGEAERNARHERSRIQGDAERKDRTGRSVKSGSSIDHDGREDATGSSRAKDHSHSQERNRRSDTVVPNVLPDLDVYSLEYTVRSALLIDTVTIQVLAAEDQSHGGSAADTAPSAESAELIRLEIASLGPTELSSKLDFLGYDVIEKSQHRYVPYLELESCRGEHSCVLQHVHVELWRPVVLSCIHDILGSFASAKETSSRRRQRAESAASELENDSRTTAQSAEPPIATSKPLVELLPENQLLHFAVSSSRFKLGGVDPKPKLRACRGILVQSGPICAEYLMKTSFQASVDNNDVSRSKLELRRDFRSDASAVATAGKKGGKDDSRQALFNLSIVNLVVDPLVEVRPHGATDGDRTKNDREGSGQRHKQRRRAKKRADSELIGRAAVDSRPVPKGAGARRRQEATPGNRESLLSIPQLDFRGRIHKAAFNDQAVEPGDSLDEVVLHLNSKEITLRLELFGIYLCLVTIASLRWLKPTVHLSTFDKSRPAQPENKRPKPLINFTADCRSFHVVPTLPHETYLFMTFRHLVLRVNKNHGIHLRCSTALLAGKSRIFRGKWEDIVRLQSTSISIVETARNAGHQPFVVNVRSDSARLRIPYRYVFNQIIDNAASLFKATKQLVHEHLKGRWDCIIEPTNEEAKRLPEINLDLGVFAVEFDDDPLERKLNMIWRVGYEEQKARLGRDKAFEVKAEAVRKGDEGIDSNPDGQYDSSEEENIDGRAGPKVSGCHTVSLDEAKQSLHAFNASQWIHRMKNATAEQARREEKQMKRLYGDDPAFELPINLLPRCRAAPLGRGTFHAMRLSVTQVSCGDAGVPDYLFDVGKGLPRDTKFSLLVPIHLAWTSDEVRFTMRDYPLPLLHIPRNKRPGVPAWECKADFVVAEELGGPDSVRHVKCSIIPPRFYPDSHKGYIMTVPRSAMPVKTYTAPKIKIRSGEPVRIGWGNSVQPAIQDIARVIESITKNSPDPSDRIGFWDKVRLALHWRVAIDFLGDKAAVIFHLKGSRDPHSLSAYGAGFAKAWAGNVKFRIGYDNPDHEFFQITSRMYILGIPNLREYLDTAITGNAREVFESADGSLHTAGSEDLEEDAISEDLSAFEEPELEQAYWIKTCAKCRGGVRWGLGLRFERACRDDSCDDPLCQDRPIFERRCRFFDFKPHWEVRTKTLKTAPRDKHGNLLDSFAGFRSDHLHFSISMTSPATLPLPNRDPDEELDRDQVKPSIEAVDGQGDNSFHFTPHAIAHFRRWWSLFDGTMSLPIRHGPVFPSTGAPSKKFGKHCATIKYRFSIAPLYISHTYAQDTWAEWRRGETTAVGLKAKIGRFNVDMHQREQETVTRRDSEEEPKIVRHKAFYLAEVDLDSVDLRVITALFQEPEKASIPVPEAEEGDGEGSPTPILDVEGDPEDTEWHDRNDFNDSGHIFEDSDPRIRVFPFIVSPRFTYFRHVEAVPASVRGSDSEHSGDQANRLRPTTKFGSEPTHTCLVGRSTDTVEVQIREAKMRLAELQSQLSAISDQARKAVLESRIKVIEDILERLQRFHERSQIDRVDDMDAASTSSSNKGQRTPSSSPPNEYDSSDDLDHLPHLKDSVYRDWRDWTNRYVVHNPKIQISNDVRDLLLKYYYSSRDRKAFVYHISAAAIKFIRDLDAQDERNRPTHGRSKSASQVKKEYEQAEEAKNRLLNDLSSGGGSSTVKDELDKDLEHDDSLNLDPDSAGDDLPDDLESNASHLCMFINPQISLHSDADPSSTLIFTALRVNFKTFQVVDPRVPDDPINYEVLHQNFVTLDGLQAFYPRHHRDPAHGRAEAIFVPIETQLKPDVDEHSFERVVAPTSVRVRYDKFNQLLIHGDHKLGSKGFKSFVDRINAEGDKLVITAKAEVYVAIFNILFRLLLQSDQQRQLRNAKVKALAFTHDFSNRTGVLRSVGERQDQIRQLIPEILEYQLHLDEIDDHEKRNLFALRARLSQLTEEISLFVEGLSLAQETNGPKTTSKRPGVQLRGRAAELTWTMIRSDSSPFVKASVVNVDFTWTSKDDGSATNRLIIGDLEALNPAPDALFSEIIKKAKLPASEPETDLARADIFAVAVWDSLAPVGGIEVVERFLLHLHPVALQLEHRLGRQILDYLFSERIKNRKEEISSEADRSRLSPQKSRDSHAAPYSASMNQSIESFSSGSQRSSRDQVRPASANANPPSTSSSSIRSVDKHPHQKAVSNEILRAAGQEEGLDAEEMKARAARFRAFLAIEISCTVLRLTYRSEESDHSMIPNVYNVTCRTPTIQFSSKTTSFAGLVDDIKHEMIKSLWSQKGKLLGQILSRAHRTLPLQEQRSAVSTKVKSKLRNPLKLRRRTKENDALAQSTMSRSDRSSSALRRITSNGSSTSSSSSSVREELEDEHLTSQGVRLIDPSEQYTAEPDPISEEKKRELLLGSSAE
ncbi:uncharacterized protein JCM15063_004656 [Sporobolomyces koalae]|uniref:uncharacterized protein n=1 Tax=Sporobolomyces koalae TaxID=500713 RepID=UPI003175DBA5